MRLRAPRTRRELPSIMQVGVEQRRRAPPGLLGQHGEAGLQLAELLARRGDGGVGQARRSASTAVGRGCVRRGASAGASAASKTGPMATPGETGMPRSGAAARGRLAAAGRPWRRLRLGSGSSQSSWKPASTRRGQGVQRLLGVPALGLDGDLAPRPAPSIISPMMERPAPIWPSRDHVEAGGVALGQGDQLGGGAGVQAALVADGRRCWRSTRSAPLGRPRGLVRGRSSACGTSPARRHSLGAASPFAPPLPGRSGAGCRRRRRCISARRRRRGPPPRPAARLPRILASLTSSGRLTPATTSTPLAVGHREMARLEGVPPNMSVSRTTPSPWFDLGDAARMIRRGGPPCRPRGRCRRWRLRAGGRRRAPWRGAAPRPGGHG